ncbi:MAG TPA: prepilin-type N-terminal cleavage/methylation domain-containing protein [Solirubrobacteraceae bacterium]|jgi:prepilin-type N-terminal cleavage/methylation domain-containing protein
MPCTRRIRTRLRDERGMTMIELMVAAMICAVGTIATIGVLDQSRASSVKSEKRDAMAHQAEREMERLMELPWNNLAHSSSPVSSATAGSPASYVSGANYKYDRNNPTAMEQLVVSAANGQVSPTYDTWNDAQTRITGRTYRYVTKAESFGADLAPNARRITVIVTADGLENPAPLLISSIKTDPIL